MAEYRFDIAPDIAEIPRLLDWVEECCAQCGVDGETPFKFALALEEAVANVINHAFAGTSTPPRIAVELAIDGDRVAAEVTDNGRPFDPTAAPEPDRAAPLKDRDVGGLGIHLIRRMMDRVDYRRAGNENRLRLEKARN
jgi:anti-sigma regulatory factor (Ser/Thr protein kinase)